MLSHDKKLKGIRGGRDGSDANDEAVYFHVCGECGQAFDLRSLAQVVHHDKPGHEPLTGAAVRRAKQ